MFGNWRVRLTCLILLPWMGFALIGCGTTKHHTATEQLLMSDAVDATVAKLDFSPLAQRKVFLDSEYINKPAFSGQSLIIDSNYLLSALRQQMVADGVLLVDKKDDAELIAEPRIGALGIDGHDVVYGMPASSAISSASTAVTGTPLLPPLPEISVARREDKLGAAKVAVFAYDRVTLQPYWQSGIAQSNSNSRATWILGVGPFQQGTIHDGTQFAGGAVLPTSNPSNEYEQQLREQYLSSQLFQPEFFEIQSNAEHPQQSEVVAAGFDTSTSENAAVQTANSQDAESQLPEADSARAKPSDAQPSEEETNNEEVAAVEIAGVLSAGVQNPDLE